MFCLNFSLNQVFPYVIKNVFTFITAFICIIQVLVVADILSGGDLHNNWSSRGTGQ